MCMLKSPSIIAFSMLGSFEVSSLVIFFQEYSVCLVLLGWWMIYTKDCHSFIFLDLLAKLHILLCVNVVLQSS